MGWLLFLFRLAFISGFAFLLSIGTFFFKELENHVVVSTLILIGHVVGMIAVPLSLLCYLFLWIAGKKPGKIIPLWLVIVNIVFLVALLSYIFYFNDPYYN